MNKIILMTAIFSLQSLTSYAQANVEAAKVNDKVITLDQVNARIEEQMHAGASGTITRKAAVDDLVKREAAIQEARKLKLDQDPVIADRINNVLYYALLDKKLGGDFEKITLSDAEAKNWYEKNPEIRTSQIFIALPADASEADEQKASARLSQILSEVKAGKMSFAEAAQKNSEDPSASLGGDLDYRMIDRLDPTYYKAALRLGKTGDITGPVRTPFGLHLIRLTGKHAWIEVDRTRVKRIILEEKRQEIVARYLNDLRQKAKVSINEKAIR
jgi:peptidyl-prolyl cis-trans isomerase C